MLFKFEVLVKPEVRLLAPHSARLVSAKRQLRVRLLDAVDPDGTGAQRERGLQTESAVAGEDVRREAVDRVVRMLDRFGE